MLFRSYFSAAHMHISNKIMLLYRDEFTLFLNKSIVSLTVGLIGVLIDRSLFKVFESKKCGNVTFGDRRKSQIKGKGIFSLLRLPDIANILYVEGLRMNLLSISQICDQNFMMLFSKGKCLVLNEFGKKLISGVRTLDNFYGLVPDANIVCNSI